MKSINKIAIILVISVVLFCFYLFIIEKFLGAENQLSINKNNKEALENLANKYPPLATKYPFQKSSVQWTKNDQAYSNSPEPTKKSDTSEQNEQAITPLDISLKIQDLLLGYIKSISQSTTAQQNDSNPKSVGDYYKNFIDIALKVNFSNEELSLLKKGSDGKRVLLLEELIENAAGGADLNELKSSFSAWHQLDERILAELNKYPVNNDLSSIHKSLTGWFSYHSNVARLLSEGNLSVNQISQLQKEFRDKAETHTTWFGESLAKLKNSPEFAFIPETQAITCGALVPPPFYHFGGRVTVLLPCDWGIVETITPPCGGLLLFTYPVLAANPYLWKKPTPGSAVLGKSTLLPGVCPLGICPLCTLWPYEAVVLYFGTSGLP